MDRLLLAGPRVDAVGESVSTQAEEVVDVMPPLKCLIVYRAGEQWFGSEVEWARSGSGWYRQTLGVPIPQTVGEIEAFAAQNGYRIEWRDGTPGELAMADGDTGTSVTTW